VTPSRELLPREPVRGRILVHAADGRPKAHEEARQDAVPDQRRADVPAGGAGSPGNENLEHFPHGYGRDPDCPGQQEAT
jgi:1,6-anhydro-N-acetylmuramate kinase